VWMQFWLLSMIEEVMKQASSDVSDDSRQHDIQRSPVEAKT
jgi:hypothetical protein